MITINTIVNQPIEKTWNLYTNPEHITQWNFASDDWHCPHAENDLRIGGKFKFTMASKDGEMSFDFEGNYVNVIPFATIEYTIIDHRKVIVNFEKSEDKTIIAISFEPETIHSEELQKQGWQNILNNFKKYSEL
jgi:uncharacterized protein YndB with AHSA1/START domain